MNEEHWSGDYLDTQPADWWQQMDNEAQRYQEELRQRFQKLDETNLVEQQRQMQSKENDDEIPSDTDL